jgi:predicted esterase
MDVSLCFPPDEAVGGTLMISGAPIVVDEWAEKLNSTHKGARVLVTHGRSDPTLPFMVRLTYSLITSWGCL